MVRKFPAADVLSVEQRDAGTAPPPDSRAAPARPTSRDADRAQMLREAFELMDDGQTGPALQAMQDAVVGASPERIRELEALCRSSRRSELPELMAQTRIRVALEAGRGRTFHVRFATPYESAALGAALERRAAVLLAKEYGGHIVADWPAATEEYGEVRPDSRRLVADASLATAMISTRIRFDPRLKQDRAERRRLIAQREELSRFVARVLALKGYTDEAALAESGDPNSQGTPATDPERQPAEPSRADEESPPHTKEP
jgi:hypothetical protein